MAGEVKHTPGPWVLIDIEGKLCPAGAGDLSILTVTYEDDTAFAAVYEPADARLIAAAPDLLEALKLMQTEADAADVLGYGWNKARELTHTAIAKAEGQS